MQSAADLFRTAPSAAGGVNGRRFLTHIGCALIYVKALGAAVCDGKAMNEQSSQTASQSAAAVDDVFDVRPIHCRVKHAQIFQRWFDLPVGRHFVLLNDHDPVPLYYQFSAQFPEAFAWDYLERGPEDFRVKITKLKAVAAPDADLPLPAVGPAEEIAKTAVREIDARGLEPPEPLIRILNSLESLPQGGTLRAHTDREPCHLFNEATQRGFSHESREQADGSWVTVLTRA